eukprot:jgi/Picre1/31801/NNA_007150.t1
MEQAYIEDAERFPGWKGELPNSFHVTVDDSVGYKEGENEVWRGRIEQLSWSPRAYVLHNFLSDEECDHLISLGKGSLHKSSVHEDDVVTAIEKRIATVTMLPEENGESLQLLRYVDGQKYEPHTDYFHDKVNSDVSHGGQRIATVLMYLSTPEEGGETVFPHAEPKVEGDEWSECAKKGLAVKAKRGNALFFYSLKPDGKGDVRSGGVKVSSKMDCVDTDDNCEEWATIGECDKNPEFMRSACPKSCNQCKKKAFGRKAGGVV